MTILSVNINKFAIIRNSRGNNYPDIIKTVLDIQRFGGEGITVHPRPDERHIKYKDVYNIKNIINVKFNIEGNPTEKFIQMILEIKPDQVTLVPDKKDAITSHYGWNIINNIDFLKEIVNIFEKKNIKTSIFIDPDPEQIIYANIIKVNSVELNTRFFSENFNKKNYNVINNYMKTAFKAKILGINVNAGHDLNIKNISFFLSKIPFIKEVSIGHALVVESIYYGLENIIKSYLKKIEKSTNYQ